MMAYDYAPLGRIGASTTSKSAHCSMDIDKLGGSLFVNEGEV